jgi:predicted transglutaminase-like cysteine proteinase
LLFHLRQAAIVASLFALVACSHTLPGTAALPAQPGFASNAILVPNSPVQRWRAVEQRFADTRAAANDGCADATCPAARWSALVERLRALPPRERVFAADAELNRVPYVSAVANWGNPAYWETPYEFLSRGGQCQDYAIAKYLALAESGFPRGDLRFVVVRDMLQGLDHAITIADLDGDSLVLDNQSSQIVSESMARARYTPYYAIDTQGLHVYASAMRLVAQTAETAPKSFGLAHYY